MKESNIHVFVYGTLKHGHSNHGVLGASAKMIADGFVEGFQLFDLGYFPAAVPHTGATIYGELYQVPQTQLASLDHLEGHWPGREGNFYERKLVQVHHEQGPTEALVYYQTRPPERAQLLENGRWPS